MGDLGRLKEELAKQAEFIPLGEAFAKEICVSCQNPPRFKSEAGVREYKISGLCEYCYDEIMGAI